MSIEAAIKDAIIETMREMLPVVMAEIMGTTRPDREPESTAVVTGTEAARRLGLTSLRTLSRSAGFPQPVMAHPKRWLWADIERWQAQPTQRCAKPMAGRKRKAGL